MLEDEEVDFIRKEIEKSSISIPELKDDLLDHFCCFIEYEIKKGNSFEAAFTKALNQICPNGFDEIQTETIYLLNAKKIIFMKKFIYSFGLITAMCFSIGWLFRIMHLPGSYPLVYFGSLGFILGFVPMMVVDRYKFHQKKILSEKLKITFGLASAVVAGLGFVFKIMHFPGAVYLIAGGALLFLFGFLPFLFFRMLRKPDVLPEKLTITFGFASAILAGSGFIFKLMHLSGAGILIAGGALLFLFGFLPLLFFRMYQKSNELSKRLEVIFGSASAMVTGLGVVFKMMHFPGAGVLLNGGVVMFIICFLPLLFFRFYKKAVEL